MSAEKTHNDDSIVFTIDNLADDIWFKIFQHLPYNDLSRISQVNRRLYALLNTPAMQSVWIMSAFHQQWDLLTPLLSSNSIRNEQIRSNLKNSVRVALDFFQEDKHNFAAQQLNKNCLKQNYYNALSQTEKFKDLGQLKKIYNEINDIQKRLKNFYRDLLNSMEQKHKGDRLTWIALTLCCLPVLAQLLGIALALHFLFFDDSPANRSRTDDQAQERKYAAILIMSAAIFPPMIIVPLIALLVDHIKFMVNKFSEKKHAEDLEWELDELKASMEETIAYHHNRPATDNTIKNNQFDPEILQQRDALITLFTSERFKNTNSTGILNIQNTIAEHPHISCDKLFTLIQTEINNRTSIQTNVVSFFKDQFRNSNMQLLYNKVNGGQFGLLPKMDLVGSSDDRKSLIKFIKDTPSFVSKVFSDNDPGIKFGASCFG